MSGNTLVLIWCQDRTFVGAMIGLLCTADFSFVLFFLLLFVLGIMHLHIEICVGLKLFWTKVMGSNPLLPNA